ncbi:MAG: bifunctional (p)ppGpp synthetase/guanosine-3',5'-bis(diphosphate) 3'-pyrophosphohydrolase [Bacilli bacterium]|nr:bifunctional (p)ppGpp synthetase/guanosine-3',5'-bis(diphosphate) 3'-pyrophosphohydrolase [Bacilli bacterium]
MEKEEAIAKLEQTLIPNGGYPIHTFDDLKVLYYPYITNEADRKLIEEAYLLAEKKHAGVFRKSGEPYIVHPIEVAYITAQLNSGPTTICAALLHDTVEDTDLTIEDIQSQFGEDVAGIVDALTKIQRMKLSRYDQEEFEAEDHRKIFLGMAKDVRVIIVKLADRLHNLRTLNSLKPERQYALSKETLEVFTPIAHRLGLYKMQSEMEDLCLKRVEPDAYAHIVKLLDENTENRAESLNALKKRIADAIYEQHIPFRMESRVKSIHSIYRKMYLKSYEFENLYDVLAIRVITDTDINCYEILGMVHAMYKPIPGRFKDYIAVPKPNMYQSLHTSIISGDGNIYEIQIRTEKMDEIAESGVAAHWKYKEGSYNPKEEQKDIENSLHWFRDFVSMSGSQDGDAKEYMAALSNDIFNANVYVFTPKGKVIDLPTGATILDFAYRIHTKVGDSAVGGKVNGNFVPLNTELHTGDVCEIRTSKTTSGPNDSWLEIAKTKSAKSHIKRAIMKKRAEMMKDDNIQRGKEMLLELFKSNDKGEGEMNNLIEANQARIYENYHVESIDEFFAAIGNKSIQANLIIDFLGARKKTRSLKLSKHDSRNDDKYPVYIENAGRIAISLAKCCTPVPGDEIVGYISKGKGVAIHRCDCPNIADAGGRLLHDVHWKDNLGASVYPVDVQVQAEDHVGMLADVLAVLSARGVNCADLRAKLIKNTRDVLISIKIYISDSRTLEDTFSALKGIKGVYRCERVIH